MLREARERAGLTQVALARELDPNLSPSKISIWETAREIPREPHMERLIAVLRLRPNPARLAYYMASLERAQAIVTEANHRLSRRARPRPPSAG